MIGDFTSLNKSVGSSPPVVDGPKAGLSVVIPTYNNDLILRSVLDRIIAVLGGDGISFEVLVVDDGSTDSTWEMLQDYSARTPQVKGLRLGRNRGQHFALLKGAGLAAGDILAFWDDDFDQDPGCLPDLVAGLTDECDLVNGCRGRPRSRPGLRRHLAALFNLALSRRPGFPLADPTSPYKVLRPGLLSDCPRWVLPAEYALFLARTVKEAPLDPVRAAPGRSRYSHLKLIKAGLMALNTIILGICWRR